MDAVTKTIPLEEIVISGHVLCSQRQTCRAITPTDPEYYYNYIQ